MLSEMSVAVLSSINIERYIAILALPWNYSSHWTDESKTVNNCSFILVCIHSSIHCIVFKPKQNGEKVGRIKAVFHPIYNMDLF